MRTQKQPVRSMLGGTLVRRRRTASRRCSVVAVRNVVALLLRWPRWRRCSETPLRQNVWLAAAVLASLLCGCAGKGPGSTEAYREIYQKSLLSSGAQFAALPPAVQNTVRAEAGSSEIKRVVKGASSGRIIYRISFENEDLLPPLYVAADGSLLDQQLRVAIGAAHEQTSIVTGGPITSVTLSDLPPAVVKSIQRQAPDAQVDSIVKEVKRDQTSYRVSFKDRMHRELHIGSDGTVLADSGK